MCDQRKRNEKQNGKRHERKETNEVPKAFQANFHALNMLWIGTD